MSIANKIFIFLLFITCVIVLIVLRRHIGTFSSDDINLFTITGTIASIIGLLIVIIQVVSLKRISIVTKDAVEKTIEKILSFDLITDLSKAKKTIKEIQNYNRDYKWELSLVRMCDLKEHLMRIKNSPQFVKFINCHSYNRHLIDLNTDISIIESEIQERNETLNPVKSNTRLEKINNSIIDLDTKIRGEGGQS